MPNEGRDAQLLRHIDVLPRRIAVAPITRALDADDAAFGGWLRADPAWLRADMSSGRMMACGDMGLDQAEADALIKPLRPLQETDSPCTLSRQAYRMSTGLED